MYPENFYYSQDHEWLKVEGEEAVLGITDFAQKQLGDIIYVDLPAVGKTVEAHQTLATVESVKSVSDVYSPVAGEVIEVNQQLIQTPELINRDPHGQGWILKLRLKDKSELNSLMKAADYEKFLEGLEH
ncbi:MAG TPA: glycine cleavage system protein GcvH [Candidatus Saccharicenans sp.]|jgi:glycine cleavage system H protein|nr:glycine cleavage system protein GcvH [Candidatus Saccharicenans sp.]HQO75859.1 glycine cleavage system protein GcvH [Candidatus Saccharicenans sp.]HUM79730.1 glycine cleavage system protein GcvH [Candidatus Saccharicenans sp.]